MNSSSRNGAKVIWLAVHTTEGFMTVQGLRDWKAWPGSSHASSDATGALWGPEQGFVPYSRMAWTLRNGNPISDNIEQCAWARWTRAEWLSRPLLLDATARWLADRHKAQPWIPLRRLTDDEIRRKVPGVLGHGDYSRATRDGTHTDPGPNYPWDVVLAKANAYAGNISQQEDKIVGITFDSLEQFQDAVKRAVWASSLSDRPGPWPIDRLAGIDSKTGNLGHMVQRLLGDEADGVDRLGDLWEQSDRHQQEVLEAVGQAQGGLDVEAFGDALRPVLLEAVREGMAADNDATAEEIVDRLADRLNKPAT